jgi:hypothetical protein
MIRVSGSAIISFQWATQPTVPRATAKIGVRIRNSRVHFGSDTKGEPAKAEAVRSPRLARCSCREARGYFAQLQAHNLKPVLLG